MARTYRDKTLAGPVEFLYAQLAIVVLRALTLRSCGTMSYEIYYAFVTTSTTFELVCFLAWFMLDASFAAVAVVSAYPQQKRRTVTLRLVFGVLAGIAVFHALCKMFPDEREQVTAYWTGLLLQLPIGWGQVYYLLSWRNTKGQSLETWLVVRLLARDIVTNDVQAHQIPWLCDCLRCLLLAIL